MEDMECAAPVQMPELQGEGEPKVIEDPIHDGGFQMLVYENGKLQFKPSLCYQRYNIVAGIIKELITSEIQIRKVFDMGCSDKAFLMHGLLKLPAIQEVVCIDQHLGRLVSEKQLFQQEEDRRALDLNVKLIEGDIFDVDQPLLPLFDAVDVVTLIEVVEHFTFAELPRLLWIVFGVIKPRVFIVTTPNSDFNVEHPIQEGKLFRHHDHKFELAQQEFEKFCEAITRIYPNYSVVFDGCGLGEARKYCTQIAVFSLIELSMKVLDDKLPEKELTTVQKVFALNKKKRAEDSKPSKPASKQTLPPLPCIKDEMVGSCRYAEDLNKVIAQLHSLVQSHASGTTAASGVVGPVSKLSLKEREDVPPNPPPSHFGDVNKFKVVQEITYRCVEAMHEEALLREIGRFVWCCDSHNTFYPFKDKIEKCTEPFDFLDLLKSNESTRKTFIEPVMVKSRFSFEDLKKRPAYTNENDGACSPGHKKYTITCATCPFIYIKKKYTPNNQDTPKVESMCGHQKNVVYENESNTKLWFSYLLLKEYLGIEGDDTSLRTILDKSDKYTLVQLGGSSNINKKRKGKNKKDKNKKEKKYKTPFDYYWCYIGDDDDVEGAGVGGGNDDGGDDAPRGAALSKGFTGSRGSHPSSRGGGGGGGAAANYYPSAAGGSKGRRNSSSKHKKTRDIGEQDEGHDDSTQELGEDTQVEIADHRVEKDSDQNLIASRSSPRIVTQGLGAFSYEEWIIANTLANDYSATYKVKRDAFINLIVSFLTTSDKMKRSSTDIHHGFGPFSVPRADEEADHDTCSNLSRGSGAEEASKVRPLQDLPRSSVDDSTSRDPKRTASRASSCGSEGIKSSVSTSSKVKSEVGQTQRATSTATKTTSSVSTASRLARTSVIPPKSTTVASSNLGAGSSVASRRNSPKRSVVASSTGRTTSLGTRPSTTATCTLPSSANKSSVATASTTPSAERSTSGSKASSKRLSNPRLLQTSNRWS